MRILIVTQYFWPENFRITDLALGLLERGNDVTVYTGLPNYPGGSLYAGYGFLSPLKERHQGLAIRRVPLIPRGKGGPVRLMLNYASYAVSASLLAAWSCRGHFDAILVYEPSPVTVGIPGRLLKALKHAPLLFWVQDLWPETLSATGAIRSSLVLAGVDKLVRWIYRGCDRVLVQSRAFIEPVAAQGVDPARIVYLPNSAESFYRRISASEDDACAVELSPGFRVMFAGNIGTAQDFPTIVAAADLLRNHKNIQWVVIGDGRQRSWVEDEIKSRGLEATFRLLGPRPPEAMPRYFAHADVLLATLRREPIFAYTIPSKIQSYLACGKAVVAALEGEGARVIGESGAGWVATPENPRALADAVLAASRLGKTEIELMGNRAEAYFNEHFDRSRLLARLEGVLADVT
ncbi:MAG: glycosyltransferase WbuB [Betaproteobacteria bacterium]|nr:glycosyltransferase WbuB [Betaproteobacteria bacterium]